LITSTDKEYQNAKLIKQGRRKIEPKFENLAKWISDKYNVNVIDICHELMTNMDKIRVGIAVEFYQDYVKFKEDDERWSNYDEKIQNEIAEKYIELISNVLRLKSEKKFLGLIEKPKQLKPSDIFVSTSAFEPIAREEVNTKIPEKQIEKLTSSLNSSQIWTISRCFESATLFVFTKKQKAELENSTDLKQIEDKYFALLKEYDEFNYLDRDKFKIGIDTKQNFDDNYESNWYYYYK
jgi:hypothetical protein